MLFKLSCSFLAFITIGTQVFASQVLSERPLYARVECSENLGLFTRELKVNLYGTAGSSSYLGKVQSTVVRYQKTAPDFRFVQIVVDTENGPQTKSVPEPIQTVQDMSCGIRPTRVEVSSLASGTNDAFKLSSMSVCPGKKLAIYILHDKGAPVATVGTLDTVDLDYQFVEIQCKWISGT